MKIIRANDYADMSRKAANILSAQIILKPDCVLGLATGGTPVGAYQQLVEWYNKGDLDFSGVTTVNLDEYRGLPKDHPESYWSFMHRNLFDHVNIDPAHIHLPDGTNPDADDACAQQLQVDAAHAVDDLVVLGAGCVRIGVGAVRQVDAGGVDVDVVEQVAVHEAPVAFRVVLGQAAVLVQVHGGDLREINVALVVPLHQLLVGPHRGTAGGQTQHAIGLHDDLCGNNVCRLAGHVCVILCTNDLHHKRPLSSFIFAAFTAQHRFCASTHSIAILPQFTGCCPAF